MWQAYFCDTSKLVLFSDSDTPSSKSVDGYPAAGGVLAQTKSPANDEDGYDDQYQMVSSSSNGGGQVDVDPSNFVKPSDSIVPGSSRKHDNSREVKKHKSNGGLDAGNEFDLTTPRMYEIHTRPEGDVDVKRTDYREQYGMGEQGKLFIFLIALGTF